MSLKKSNPIVDLYSQCQHAKIPRKNLPDRIRRPFESIAVSRANVLKRALCALASRTRLNLFPFDNSIFTIVRRVVLLCVNLATVTGSLALIRHLRFDSSLVRHLVLALIACFCFWSPPFETSEDVTWLGFEEWAVRSFVLKECLSVLMDCQCLI